MVQTIRFHLDEHLPNAIAQGLRRRGIDVTTIAEVGLESSSDIDQLNFAFSQLRVLVTHDADFLRLHNQGVKHAGIAYCHQRSRSIGEILPRLVLIYEHLSPEDMSGQVEYL